VGANPLELHVVAVLFLFVLLLLQCSDLGVELLSGRRLHIPARPSIPTLFLLLHTHPPPSAPRVF
jgi:hypothetical protein